MSFMARTVKQFVLIKAARQIKQEIEKAGLDNLKILADNSISIFGTYLKGCSPQEKATHRQNFNALLQMGVTADMVLTEVVKQIPELASIMRGRDDYRKSELQNLEQFLRGE